MKTYFKRALVLLVAPLMAMLLSSCEKDLTILPVEPTIEQIVTASGTFAVCSASVTCPGNITVELEWSLTPDMGNAQRQTMESDGGKFFTATMRGLSKKTTYYYRVTMTNRFQSMSSAVAQFTTLESDVPTVTTSAVDNLTHKSAEGGGNVTFNGGLDVTERGLCWSNSHNPTVSGSHASSGSGTGSFTVTMTGLEPSTTYYVRAYAVNGNGTGYGNEVSFTTADGPDPPTPPTPGNGEGSGTADDPYNVAAGISLQGQNATGWVRGYIVGAIKSGPISVSSNDDIEWAAPFSRATNVLISDDPDCHEVTNCIIVELTKDKPLRTEVNLVDHPENFGKTLSVTGTLRNYFGQAGLRGSAGTSDDFVLADPAK